VGQPARGAGHENWPAFCGPMRDGPTRFVTPKQVITEEL